MFDSEQELRRQILLGEDSVLELKNVEFRGERIMGPHANGMADEMAAMANSGDGVIILGVDDKSHTILGLPLEKLDLVEGWLRNLCNDLINPSLFCRIRKIYLMTQDGSERVVIRVDVPKSLYVHQSPGGYFHRVGSAKRQMPPDILARLFQQRSTARLIRFDEQRVPSASLENLDADLWRRFKTPLSPNEDQEFLIKLKLITGDEEGNLFPTVAGLLMASPNPQDYLPNAFIQAVAYRGRERNAAYQLDAKDITGPLDIQIRDAITFVRRNMQIHAIKTPMREEIPQFAMEAVFEAIVNAVAHRDYAIHTSKIRLHLFSDRLELYSPGSIPNTMTVESLPLRQATRNELVSSLLTRCPTSLNSSRRQFIMDKRGEGVPIILTESEKLSGKKPIYQVIDDSELLLTLFAADSPSDS